MVSGERFPLWFETRYSTKIARAKNFNPRGIDLMFSNHSKAKPRPQPAIKLPTWLSAVPFSKKRSRHPGKVALQLYFVGPVPKWVDELVRKCKIQGKLYGIECQNVISIRLHFGAPISSWLRRPGNLDSGYRAA